jgi:multidrug efflux system membrane fusion protein
MTVEALDRSQQKKLAEGTFLTLDNQVDTTTGTVRVRAIFDNTDGALFPNQFVNAKLLVHTQRDATLVSSVAIQRGAQGPYVYVVKQDQTPQIAEMRKIKVGTADGGTTAVEGINPGDVVAANGFDKLQDKAKVTAHEEKAQAAGQAAGQMGEANPQASPAPGASPSPGASPTPASQGKAP